MKKCPTCEARRKRRELEEKIVAWVNTDSPVTAREAAKRFRQDYRKMCGYLGQLAKKERIDRETYYNLVDINDGRRRVRFRRLPAGVHD